MHKIAFSCLSVQLGSTLILRSVNLLLYVDTFIIVEDHEGANVLGCTQEVQSSSEALCFGLEFNV